MKPRDAFGVVVRSVGLLMFVFLAYVLLIVIATPFLLGLPFALLVLVIGIYLLRGAPLLMKVAYGSSEDPGRFQASSTAQVRAGTDSPSP